MGLCHPTETSVVHIESETQTTSPAVQTYIVKYPSSPRSLPKPKELIISKSSNPIQSEDISKQTYAYSSRTIRPIIPKLVPPPPEEESQSSLSLSITPITPASPQDSTTCTINKPNL